MASKLSKLISSCCGLLIINQLETYTQTYVCMCSKPLCYCDCLITGDAKKKAELFGISAWFTLLSSIIGVIILKCFWINWSIVHTFIDYLFMCIFPQLLNFQLINPVITLYRNLTWTGHATSSKNRQINV